MKSRIQVVLLNSEGIAEDGIDGGGLFREFMDLLAKRIFDPSCYLFVENNERFLYPNPSSKIAFMDAGEDARDASRNDLSHFRFAGAIVGKAVYEGLLVEPQFANFFLNRLLGKFNYTDDLQSLDPELYHNLMYLKTYKGDFKDLGLTFAVSQDLIGDHEEIELCPGGKDRNVERDNVREYITRMAQYRLKHQINSQSDAFADGFHSLIDSRWILMFNPDEIRMIISGTHQTVDIADLRKHTQYSGGYYEEEDAIQWFWEIIEDFSTEDKAALLKFVTSCSRQPLLGFSELNPKFCIQRTEESDKLPTSATCMNILKLPQYSSKETMQQKLLYAINAGAGFDLT